MNIYSILFLFIEHTLFYRTAQEELRDYYSKQPREAVNLTIGVPYFKAFMPNSNAAELQNASKELLTNTRQDETLDGLYGLLSTEWCIYIHGGLMAGLFTIALMR